MKDFSTILIPFDFSQQALEALNYATQFFHGQEGRSIILLHVLEENLSAEEQQAIKQRLQKVATDNQHLTATPISAQTLPGSIPAGILEAQQKWAADAIVMGTKGQMNHNSKAATNTAQLVYEAECPVIVVPQGRPDFALKKLILLLDQERMEEPEKLFIPLALARQFDAEVHVLTFYDDEEALIAKGDALEQQLAYYFDRFYTNHIFIKNAQLLDGIKEYIQTHDIDLFAVIPNHHATKGKASEGRLTRLLTMEAPIPLLSIDL